MLSNFNSTRHGKISFSGAAASSSDVMNEREVASYLGRSVQTIRKMRKAGIIPFRQAPGFRSVFYSRSMIDQWIMGADMTTEQNAAAN